MKMRGEKCVLRALSDEYATEFSSFLTEGINFEHTFTGSLPMRPIDVQAEWQEERKRHSLQWGIFRHDLLQDNFPVWNFIGTTGLYSVREIYRSWEFRILIGKPGELGRGIGTEACRMVLDWAFSRLNAHRVWLGLNQENMGAFKCYQKCGFKTEGVLRDELWCNGKYVNAVRMGILEDEWRGLKPSSSAAGASE